MIWKQLLDETMTRRKQMIWKQLLDVNNDLMKKCLKTNSRLILWLASLIS